MRFQNRCVERASEARHKAVERKRCFENDDPFLEKEDDELYRRVMAHANKKMRDSYEQENRLIAGAPLNEDEDMEAWEAELAGMDQDQAALEAYLEGDEEFWEDLDLDDFPECPGTSTKLRNDGGDESSGYLNSNIYASDVPDPAESALLPSIPIRKLHIFFDNYIFYLEGLGTSR